MKNVFRLPVLLAAALLCSCEKSQTDAEKNADVERRVQERLAAERQTQEQQRLTQGQIDLDQRLKDVEQRNDATTSATAVPETQSQPDRARASRPPTARRTQEDSGSDEAASYSTFYTKLEPQGEWRETSNYGYVWQPRVAQQSRDWRPYTNGRWVYTEAGCTWVSDEPFGWATYHYGRWTRLRSVGWVWVPGDQWAPAWVSWRKSNDYVGWAPLPPEAHFERNRGIHNWADNDYDIGPDQYTFVPTRQLGDQSVERSVVPIDRNVAIISQTTNITNITYNNKTVVNQGPNYEEMRSRTQQPMERLRLERQVTVNFEAGEPHSVVRGGVVEMPAPVMARAQAVERPHNVRGNIVEAVVDHGWERMGDRQAAESVRIKMKSEATPPPNGPARMFIPAEPAASRVPAASAIPGPSARREMPPRPAREESPAASATVHPVRPVATPTPAPTAVATPQATAPAQRSPVPRIDPQVAPSNPPHRNVPSPSPSVAQEPLAPTGAASGPPPGSRHSGEAKEARKAERQTRREDQSPVQPLSTSTPVSAGPTAPVGDSSLSKKEQRHEERKATRQGRAGAGESAAPSSTPQ